MKTVIVYRHPKKDTYNRFVYDYSDACGSGPFARSLLKRDSEEAAIKSLYDYIASAIRSTQFTIKIVEKSFVVY